MTGRIETLSDSYKLTSSILRFGRHFQKEPSNVWD